MRSFWSIFLISSLVVSQARASNSGLEGLFVAAAIGGGINAGVQGALGRLPDDLKDWADPMSQSTSRLSEQCGVLTEMKIVKTGRMNFLFLGIRNEGSQDIQIRMDRVLARFGNGKERYFLSPGDNRTQEIKRGWYSWGLLAFPRKMDFKDQTQLDVVVPAAIGNGVGCELKAQFNRNVNVEQDPSSYLEAPSLIVSMGGGFIGSRLGGLDAATHGNGAGLELYFAGFRAPQSGWYWQLSAYALGDVEEPQKFEGKAYEHIDAFDMSIGKVWRFFHTDTTTSYFNVGPSGVSYSALRKGVSDDNRDTRGGLGLYTSYTYEWRYAREHFGVFRGDYALGITAYAKYYPVIFNEGTRDAGTLGIVLEVLRGGE